MSTYDKNPEIKVTGYEEAAHEGYRAIADVLRREIETKKVVVVDCYPGVEINEVIQGLESLYFETIIRSDDCAFYGDDLTAVFKDYLTEDRVFGVLTTKNFKDVFMPSRIEEARKKINETNGPVLVIGVAASLITTGDVYIYADLARWEIQMRYRAGKSNWNCENATDPILQKYKRGYFIEWRMADRHKVTHFDQFDYVLDTNVAHSPKLVSAEGFFAGLVQTVSQPFRVVPYFDPGVWGGQWMKKVCGLDESQENFAWSFDGVPEENSLYLRYGDIRLEVPSINVVFYKAKELLGDKVHARFGTEFPIRFDFLDTMDGQNLSLQVHPLTEYIQKTFGMHYTQDESYYILDCKEDACVYLGLKDDVNRTDMISSLKSAQEQQTSFEVERFVNKFKANKHDHFLIPAGTVHCSGKNAMVLEISATPYIFTFKLFDWDRVGLDGLPRPIHIEHGEQVIDWSQTTEWVTQNLVNQIEKVSDGPGYIEERTGLHEREFIETRRHWFKDIVHHTTNGSVNVLNLIDGEEAMITSPTDSFEPFVLHYAETVIIPEHIKQYSITPSGPSVGKKIATIKAYVR